MRPSASCFGLFLLALMGGPAAAQDMTAVYQAAQEMGQAMVARDYETMIDQTYPRLVALSGGREAMLRMFSRGTASMQADGIAFYALDLEGPVRFDTTAQRIFAVLPYRLVLQVPGGYLISHSALLGILDDTTQGWQFIDGSGLDRGKLLLFFPDETQLSERLKLPPRLPPTFVTTLEEER